ncbi:molybdenum cofactor biosynthesis protein MoaE [Verrucomicrobia bacterium LW23]|nr:molybdenum cofactor biosynthesis protein MoaE [Verrucomicrobia bacterium LW23]
MNINVILTRQPVHFHAFATPSGDDENGAFLDLFGVVRGTENKKKIAGLDYSAYEKMAVAQLHTLVEELALTYPVNAVQVVHRLGFVPAGEASMLVRVASPHRAEALGMMEKLIYRMKQDVPIWKQVVDLQQDKEGEPVTT